MAAGPKGRPARAPARVFRSLVANALLHGADAPSIGQRGGLVTFEDRVANPGALDIDRLFERFYQGGGSRSGAGAGLGLAIVAQLADAMGAEVDAALAGDVLRIAAALRGT